MANKVTPNDIQLMNELYYELHNKAEVARRTGFSASTVSKYIIPNWTPVIETEVKHIHMSDLPEFDGSLFVGVENYGELCILSDEERKEIELLHNEMSI